MRYIDGFMIAVPAANKGRFSARPASIQSVAAMVRRGATAQKVGYERAVAQGAINDGAQCA